MSRNLWGVHLGASYQYSPETISSLPSPLMSAKAAVSLAPLSIITFSNGTSAGREMLHTVTTQSAASARTQTVFVIAAFSHPRHAQPDVTDAPIGGEVPVSNYEPRQRSSTLGVETRVVLKMFFPYRRRFRVVRRILGIRCRIASFNVIAHSSWTRDEP